MKPKTAPTRLSKREREVADLLLLELSDKEVANEMDLAVPTVRSYLRALYRKLGCHNRTGAALRWMRAEQRRLAKT